MQQKINKATFTYPSWGSKREKKTHNIKNLKRPRKSWESGKKIQFLKKKLIHEHVIDNVRKKREEEGQESYLLWNNGRGDGDRGERGETEARVLGL